MEEIEGAFAVESGQNTNNTLKKILFIGGVWLESEENDILNLSKGPIQTAANNFQNSIIGGLDYNMRTPTTVLSSIFIGSFPLRYKRMIIKGGEFNHCPQLCNNHTDYKIPFINLPILKHFARKRAYVRVAKDVLSKMDEREVAVCGYSMTYSTVFSLTSLKKRFPNIRTCLIVPDLPQYMNLGKPRGPLFSIAKKLMNKIIYKGIRSIDSFVVLTKYMYSELHVPNNPYVVVEGIAPDDDWKSSTNNSSKKQYVLYSGSLDEKYGIKDLVNGFHDITSHEIELVLCGDGDTVPYIKELSARDSRIRYLGTVSCKIARQLQSEAMLLVNPRSDQEEYTKYSFPSKTLEYMMSGTPILMYKLQGVPEEYDQYVYYIEGDLKNELEKTLSISLRELKRKGMKAKQFAQQNKNKAAQSLKIIQMLEDIERRQ